MQLNFQFGSVSELWFMAGHGPYVWACYAVTLVVLMWLVLAPMNRRRQFFVRLERQQRLENRANASAKKPANQN